MLRESAKVTKEIKEKDVEAKRLGAEEQKDDANMMGRGGAEKRKKMGPGLSVHPIVGGAGKMQIDSSGPK